MQIDRSFVALRMASTPTATNAHRDARTPRSASAIPTRNPHQAHLNCDGWPGCCSVERHQQGTRCVKAAIRQSGTRMHRPSLVRCRIAPHTQGIQYTPMCAGMCGGAYSHNTQIPSERSNCPAPHNTKLHSKRGTWAPPHQTQMHSERDTLLAHLRLLLGRPREDKRARC